MQVCRLLQHTEYQQSLVRQHIVDFPNNEQLHARTAERHLQLSLSALLCLRKACALLHGARKHICKALDHVMGELPKAANAPSVRFESAYRAALAIVVALESIEQAFYWTELQGGDHQFVSWKDVANLLPAAVKIVTFASECPPLLDISIAHLRKFDGLLGREAQWLDQNVSNVLVPQTKNAFQSFLQARCRFATVSLSRLDKRAISKLNKLYKTTISSSALLALTSDCDENECAAFSGCRKAPTTSTARFQAGKGTIIKVVL